MAGLITGPAAGMRQAIAAMPLPVRVGLALLGLVLAVYVLELALGLVPGRLETAFEGTANHLTMLGAGGLCAARAVAVCRERAVWALFAAGLLLWGLGDLYYTLTFWGLEEAPFPSLADLGYFLFYPPVYAGLFLLLRARLPRVGRLLGSTGLPRRSAQRRSPRRCCSGCCSPPTRGRPQRWPRTSPTRSPTSCSCRSWSEPSWSPEGAAFEPGG